MINNVILSCRNWRAATGKNPSWALLIYILFDMLAMFLIFQAIGYNIHPGVLFASYGIPFLLSKIAFIFPGGIGVIEASMAAIKPVWAFPAISVVAITGYGCSPSGFNFAWFSCLSGYLNRNKNALKQTAMITEDR